jgi:hypothetical protein
MKFFYINNVTKHYNNMSIANFMKINKLKYLNLIFIFRKRFKQI